MTTTSSPPDSPGRRPAPAVVLVAVDSLQRAEVIVALLSDSGFDAFVVDGNTVATFWHIEQIIAPRGIQVAVPAGQAPAAMEALTALVALPALEARVGPPRGRRGQMGPLRQEEIPGSADYHALRASQCGLFSLIFPPLLLAVPYHLLKALARSRRGKPQSTRYGVRLCVSLFMLLFWAAVVVLLGSAAMGRFNQGTDFGDFGNQY